MKAFDVLYKFEVEASKYESSPQQAKTPSHWAAEAMAWASTYEQVTGSSLDVDISEKSRKGIRFSEFAVSCRFPEVTDRVKSPIKVYFSESSRTRRDVLQHVFKPLLADVFSFNVVYSIFDHLGIRSDCSYIQKCIGEWFLTISVSYCPIVGIGSVLRRINDIASPLAFI